MERSELEIAAEVRASAPTLPSDLRGRVLTATQASMSRRRRSAPAFAMGWAAAAACLICVQVVVVGGLNDRQQALMASAAGQTDRALIVEKPTREAAPNAIALTAALANRTRFLSALLSDIGRRSSTSIERNGHVTI